jgi:dolichyl-phosphate beta-glucosyltransferase
VNARSADLGKPAPLFSLVLPAYNPGNGLAKSWAEVESFLDRTGQDWEIIFVCDGCTDGTAERLERLSQHNPDRIRVLAYAPNRGKGYAVRKGLQAARGQWRIFTDIDLAYSFDDVERIGQALRSGADVAIASRLHRDSRLVLPPRLLAYAYRRHLQSQLFGTIVRWILPLRQADTQAGLKGLSAAAVEMLMPHIQSAGFEFDCELLTACARHGLPVVEVPVHVRYHDRSSTTNWGTAADMIRQLWRIRRSWSARPVSSSSPAQTPGPEPKRRAA